ncbi:MAG: hypothetical protein U0667_14485 [Chloroflexota bacterium]
MALPLLSLSSVAAAECSEFDPWPRFTEAAPGATHIAIVEVIRIVDEREAGDSRPPLRYRVRTIENVRGTLPSSFTLPRVWTRDSHPCIPYQLNAAPGDRLALAYGSPHDGIGGWLSAVAFVGHGFHAPSGTNVIDRNYRMQVLSARTVRRFGSLPATDTGSAAVVPVEAAARAVVRWVEMAGAWLWALRR